MRAIIFAVSLVCVAGCGNNATTPTDMAAAIPDMAASNDLAQLSCAGLILCLKGCSTLACQQNCQAMASPQALLDAEALSNCVSAACLPSSSGMDVDGGAGSCTSATDTSPTCQTCVANATQGSQCSSYLTTCTSD